MNGTAPIYGTQGGGKVVQHISGRFVFIEKPDCPGLEVGDFMPEEWGTCGPINGVEDPSLEESDPGRVPWDE
jgi:hypothetical protein